VPSAGPFYLDKYVDGYAWSSRETPNHFGERPAKVDAVVYRTNRAGELAPAEIERGKADGFTWSEDTDISTALEAGGVLAARYGVGRDPRWLPGHNSTVRFLQMNATHGPLRPEAPQSGLPALDRGIGAGIPDALGAIRLARRAGNAGIHQHDGVDND
jgi:hypothetical protein